LLVNSIPGFSHTQIKKQSSSPFFHEQLLAVHGGNAVFVVGVFFFYFRCLSAASHSFIFWIFCSFYYFWPITTAVSQSKKEKKKETSCVAHIQFCIGGEFSFWATQRTTVRRRKEARLSSAQNLRLLLLPYLFCFSLDSDVLSIHQIVPQHKKTTERIGRQKKGDALRVLFF